MEKTAPINPAKLWQAAVALAAFTILYNLTEGLLATYFGGEEEALTLFGFGIDSFIELISGAGIMAMVLRIWRQPGVPRGGFEQSALRVTGFSFYLLAASLVTGAILSLAVGHQPRPSLAGTIISLVSIAVMWALVLGKRKVGNALASRAILADAQCTMVCIWMSVTLLASSLLYTLTGLAFVDALGSLVLAWFSGREGREAFATAAGMEDACACGDSCEPAPSHSTAD